MRAGPAIAYSFDYKLMVVDADGTNATTIRKEPAVFHPSWSPEALHIAYLLNFNEL